MLTPRHDLNTSRPRTGRTALADSVLMALVPGQLWGNVRHGSQTNCVC